MNVGKEMGVNAGHAIYISEQPSSGDFNVALVVRLENMAQREKGADPETAAEFQRQVEEKLMEEKDL